MTHRKPYTPVGVYVVRWAPVSDDAPITYGPFTYEQAKAFAEELPDGADHRGYEISAVFPAEDMRGSRP